MTNHRDDTRFPAVERLRDELRADLLRAARANPHARPPLSRRRAVLAVAAVSLVAAPAALAGAGVFGSSADIEYECAEAEKLHEGSEPVLGAPVNGPGAPQSVVVEEPAGPPDNPCD
jgi:hypothetical protein